MIAPKYIQLAIRKYLYHRSVEKRNAVIVKDWIEKNTIDKSTPLESLLDDRSLKKKHAVIAASQMNIFDIIKG